MRVRVYFDAGSEVCSLSRPLPEYPMVFGPDGNLACHLRGFMASRAKGPRFHMADKVRNIMLAVLAGLILAASVAYWYWNSPRNKRWPASRKATCYNNLTQIGLALRTWSGANGGRFPWGVSTNDGGTMEFCAPGPDGFDRCAAIHFEVKQVSVLNGT